MGRARRFFSMFAVLALTAAVCVPAMAAGGGKAKPAAQPEADNPGRKTFTSPTFIDFDIMQVPIIRNLKVYGILVVQAGIDVKDDKLRRKLRDMSPRLEDRFLRSLNAYAGTALVAGRLPDAALIRRRLQAAVDRIARQEGARLLLQNVAVRFDRNSPCAGCALPMMVQSGR